MEKQIITVFGDILSGKEEPQRVVFEKFPADDDSGFIVDCGRRLESKVGVILKNRFLDSHPELRDVLARMEVGDIAERVDVAGGSTWTIRDKNGVVRHPIEVLEG